MPAFPGRGLGGVHVGAPFVCWVGETRNPTFPRAASVAALRERASQGKVPLTFGSWDAQASPAGGKSTAGLSPVPPTRPTVRSPSPGAGNTEKPSLPLRYFPDPTVPGSGSFNSQLPNGQERVIPVALSIPKCQSTFFGITSPKC